MAAEHAAKFLVLTTQRSGSTWFVSVLNGIEGVSAHNELFLPRPRSTERRWDSGFAYPRYIETRMRHGFVRPFSVYRYLNEFYASPGSVGFKLMYSQLRSYPEIALYLARKRIPVVHLVRANHLDVLTSFAVKRKIGKAHILADERRPDDLSVVLEADGIVRAIERLERRHELGRRVLRTLRVPHVEVRYEELARDPARYGEVCRFLGIPAPAGAAPSAIVKTRVGDRGQVIANYDEVRRALEGSRFASLLDS